MTQYDTRKVVGVRIFGDAPKTSRAYRAFGECLLKQPKDSFHIAGTVRQDALMWHENIPRKGLVGDKQGTFGESTEFGHTLCAVFNNEEDARNFEVDLKLAIGNPDATVVVRTNNVDEVRAEPV